MNMYFIYYYFLILFFIMSWHLCLSSDKQKKTNVIIHNTIRTNTLENNNNDNNTNDIFGLSPSQVPNLIDDEEENQIIEAVKNFSDLTRSTNIHPSSTMNLDDIITEISKLKKKKLKKEMKNKLEQKTKHNNNNNTIHHNNENEIDTFTQNIKTNSSELKNEDSSNSLSTNDNMVDELLIYNSDSEDDIDIHLGELQLYSSSDEDTSDYEYVNDDYYKDLIFSKDTEESFSILEDSENISLSSIKKYLYSPIGSYKKKNMNVFENFKMTRSYDEFLKIFNLNDSSSYEEYELLPGEPFKLNCYYYRDAQYKNVRKYILKEIYDNIQNLSKENKILVSEKEELFHDFIKNLLRNNFICLSYEEEEDLFSESKLLLEAMIYKRIQ
ncbi:sporozoite invasion-associated protein 2 [Plasmodium gaboni]|uniref:Sporozoite invasion-associated protein 2 n=1 Tax=Plasmodium gaboni TaxID=647221 RepID=A0A151L3N8_9APIC|nr:sporozoite invasion-associated protein 2 [Plasmodium gaboni]KYN93561.1 sporozoite invasion-associated protein 2 [Plasmodium gaboni]